MDLETLIEVVVEEVRRVLAARSQRLLVVMTGTPCCEVLIKAELARLRDSGRFQPTLLFSRTAASHWDRSGLEQALGCTSSLDENSRILVPELVWQTDVVLVPWLSLNTASRLALGLADSKVTAVLMMALLKGLPVVACADEGDPDGDTLKSWARPAPALAAMLRDRLAALRSYGMRLVRQGQLAETLLAPPRRAHAAANAAPAAAAPTPAGPGRGGQEPVPSRSGGKRVVTEADVRAALEAGDLSQLPADAIWTPLARDLARLGLRR